MKLAEDVPDWGIREKAPDLVLNRGDRLLPEGLGIARVLFRPEVADDRVADASNDAFPEELIREHARDREERRLVVVEKRKDRVVQDVLEPRPP